MTTKRTAVRLLGAAMMTLAIAPWVGGSTAHAATVSVFLDAKWNGTSSADAGLTRSGCTYTELTVAHSGTGWHFVLPGGTGLSSFSANFASAGTLTVTTTDTAVGAVVQDGKGAVVYTPTADTLVGLAAFSGRAGQGTAETAGNNDMQLSHICDDDRPTTTPPTTTTSAPATTTTSAPATTTTSAPATTTTSAPGTTTTSAAATTTTAAAAATTSTSGVSVLPTKVEATESAAEETEVAVAVEGTKTGGGGALAATGSGLPLGLALAISLGLLLGGVALLTVPGKLALERGRHRRRH